MTKHAKKIKDRIITVKINESLLEEMDHYAQKMKINRSQFVRNMIEIGLDDVKLMNRTGILRMALKGFDLVDHVKKSLGQDKYRVEENKVIIEL